MPANRKKQGKGTARDSKGRFAKGESGNPSGRPKEVGHVRELAREYTELAITTLAAIAANSEENGRARVAAAEALLDRAWGKPLASVHIATGDDMLSRVLAMTPRQRALRIAELEAKRSGESGDAKVLN